MEHHRYRNIRKIILGSMILLPFIPFLLSVGIGYYYFTTSLETSTVSSMNRIVEDHRQMIESFLNERKANLEFIADSSTFSELSRPEALHRTFENLQNASRAFADLGVFDDQGVHVAYSGPFDLTGKVYTREAWFVEVRKDGWYISDVFLGFRQAPHFIIAIARQSGDQFWVLRATIDSILFNDLVKRVRMGKTGEAYIFNSKGILQTDRRSGGNLMDALEENLRYLNPHPGIKTFVDSDATGEEYLYATTWLKKNHWMLVVRQEKADAFRALRTAGCLIFLIAIVGGAAIILVGFYMTDRIVRRMEKIDAEKEGLGRQLVRAGRLAELGEMATGFAHEINNPLQIIQNEQALIHAILSELKAGGAIENSESVADIEESIDQIKLQIDRCAQITQAILKFGRKSEPKIENIDFYAYIAELIAIVEKKAVVHGISLENKVSKETPLVHCDPVQLQQVFLNLFNNAIDAIIERHGAQGGRLVIESAPMANGKVKVTVTDNGIGISPENMKRIFTPFFTTKPVGKGTGLGLAVCYGIVDRMGGTMEVSSEKGVGTSFVVNLPCAAKAEKP